MILEDVILLGRTVPEPSKKYGVSVCGICYSPELRRYIRIYPLIIKMFKIERRGIFRAYLERPIHDSRPESFKITGYRDTKKKAGMAEVKKILEKSIDTIDNLNNKRQSIGVIKPQEFKIKMKNKKKGYDDKQIKMFEEIVHKDFMTGRDYQSIPCIITSGQEQNSIPLRDWQIFELMRHKSRKINSNYIGNIFYKKDVFFVIGNMIQFQRRWLAVTYFAYKKKHEQTQLF